MALLVQSVVAHQDWQLTWRNFMSPNNPFVPWMLIFDLVLVLAYLYSVYWVYRDALYRYRRGAPWAIAAAVLPLAGWLFYLFYRVSPLVELDRLEAELFDDADFEWTDYDKFQSKRGSELFRELAALWRIPEGEGYSPHIRLSRLKEQRALLTPEQKVARRAERVVAREQARQAQAERKVAQKEKAAEQREAKRERRTLFGAHGFSFKLSEGKQAQVRKQLQLVEELKRLPREVELLEELIYEMDYESALKAAQDSLALAIELGDEQGKITYWTYIKRIHRLLDNDHKGEADDPSPPLP